MIKGDTIAAIATAPGRGGVAVVRVSGPEAWSVAERVAGRRPSCGRILFSSFSSHSGDSREVAVDKGILLAFKAPHSYTGEDVVEFQCHGGSVTPRRVLEACLGAGARLARRGEFTERAFLNGKLDYDQAESVLDLVDAKTARAADAALEGLSGRKVRELRALYEQALDLSTRLEHALDIDEGELPEGFLPSVMSSVSSLKSTLCDAVRRSAEGRLLRDGALVVLAGPPNAGKSSLLNALLEENRAIVSDVPGTTRDSIEAWLDLDGWPIRLTDTAGLRAATDEVEGEGVKRAEELIANADVVLMLRSWEVGKLRSCETPQPLNPSTSQLLTITSKCDLSRGPGLNVSAKTGEGLDELKRAIVAKLEERVSSSDSAASASTERLAVLREALALLSPLRPSTLPNRTIEQSEQSNNIPLLPSSDLVLLGNVLRQVAEKLGALVGATYTDDMLDNLFSRFCVGK